MREVPSSAARARLSQLLDEVERGETIVITRHGRPIARIVPEVDRRGEEIARAMADLKALRKTMPSLTVEEIMSARHDRL